MHRVPQQLTRPDPSRLGAAHIPRGSSSEPQEGPWGSRAQRQTGANEVEKAPSARGADG